MAAEDDNDHGNDDGNDDHDDNDDGQVIKGCFSYKISRGQSKPPHKQNKTIVI